MSSCRRALVLAFAMVAGTAPSLAAQETAAPRPTPEAEIRLELNIPAYRLDVFVSDRFLWSYTVAVGMPRYPTPVRDFRITRVVWNPWWYPPPSDWAKDERPRPPGPTNPMGRVKLEAGLYYYVHGTPDEGSLGQAASHGCIRMANRDVLDLARLVHRFAPPRVTETHLDLLESDPVRTEAIVLDAPVAFRSVYRIAEIREGALEIHPDVYGRAPDRAGEVRRALESAGVDASRIDGDGLAALLRDSRRARVVVPLDSLRTRLFERSSEVRTPVAPVGRRGASPIRAGRRTAAGRAAADAC